MHSTLYCRYMQAGINKASFNLKSPCADMADRCSQDDRHDQQTTSFCDDTDRWRHHAAVAPDGQQINTENGSLLLDEVNLHVLTSCLSTTPSITGQLAEDSNSAATYAVGSRRRRISESHAIPPFETEDNYFDDDIIGAKLLIGSDAGSLVPTPRAVSGVISTTTNETSAIADEGLRQELDLFRTTRVLLASTIVLWLPITVANVVYATCGSCRSAMTVSEVMTVKWIAYISPLVAAMASIWCSEVLRHAVWSVLTQCCKLRTRRQWRASSMATRLE